MIPPSAAPKHLRVSPEAIQLVREYLGVRYDGRGKGVLSDVPEGDWSEDDLPRPRLRADDARSSWRARYARVADLDPLLAECQRLVPALLAAYAAMPPPPRRGTYVDEGTINAARSVVRPLMSAGAWIGLLADALDMVRAFVGWGCRERVPPLGFRAQILGSSERKRYDRFHGWVCRQDPKAKKLRAAADKDPARVARRAEHIEVLRADPDYRVRENERARKRYARQKEQAHAT